MLIFEEETSTLYFLSFSHANKVSWKGLNNGPTLSIYSIKKLIDHLTLWLNPVTIIFSKNLKYKF